MLVRSSFLMLVAVGDITQATSGVNVTGSIILSLSVATGRTLCAIET
jgi:hypothetical protein